MNVVIYTNSRDEY